MTTIERIYDRFGLPLTDPHRDRIVEFLTNNPAASRLGKHRHSPDQFGIDPGEVHERLADYYARYGHLFDRA